MSRGKLPQKYNPFAGGYAGSVAFTIGTETTNAITVSGVVKDGTAKAAAVRTSLRAYFSADANGDTILPHYQMPSGGYAIGTNGLIVLGAQSREGLINKGTLAIDATPEKFKTTSIAKYRVNGSEFTKAATTAILFTAAHVVTTSKFAVILIQVNAAGTVSSKVPVTPQAYNSAALALAALPAPDTGNVPLGYIAIAAKAATWTANTDDLTNGSDLTTATFVDAPENGYFPHSFHVTTEANGTFDIVITETRIMSLYLVVVMPDGSLSVSPVIAFA